LQVHGRDLPECRQDELNAKRISKRREGWRTTHEPLGHQADQGHERGADSVYAAPNPANRTWKQDIVSSHDVRRRLKGAHSLDLGNDQLDISQTAGESRSEAVRQQTECLLALRAVPARDVCAWRIFARVGSCVPNAAATLWVQRATREACQAPRLLANVFLAGEPRMEAKLHRPRPARCWSWRATSFSEWLPPRESNSGDNRPVRSRAPSPVTRITGGWLRARGYGRSRGDQSHNTPGRDRPGSQGPRGSLIRHPRVTEL
jgi:hypothetical protein